MKVALVDNNLGAGGAEKLIYDMALELKNRNIDFDIVLTTEYKGVYDEELKKNEINIIYLNKDNKIYSAFNIFKYIKVLKNYDIVHVQVFPVQFWVSIASIFLPKKIKFLVTEHSTNNRRRQIKFFKLIDKMMYSRYKCIIAITSQVKKNLNEWIGYENKIKIVNNGINLKSVYNVVKKDFNYFDKESKILIMISRFVKAKDHKTLIKSLKYLPQDYKLLLVGEGDLKKESEKLVLELNLGDRIKFLGFRRDIPELLKYSDLIIQSSNWEGLSLVMIEGMASGTPIIGSKVEGIANLLEREELLFEKGNEKELSEKIERIFEDKNLYKEMSKYLLDKSKEYSIEKTTDEYIKIYNEL